MIMNASKLIDGELIELEVDLKIESMRQSYLTSSSLSSPTKASTLKAKSAPKPSFPQILATPPLESCHKSTTLKDEHISKKEFNVNTIFSSSKRSSATFRRIMQEKGLDAPTSHSRHAHFILARKFI